MVYSLPSRGRQQDLAVIKAQISNDSSRTEFKCDDTKQKPSR